MAKKILLVTEYYPPKVFGGGEINIEITSRALAKAGNDVHVATSYFKGLKKKEEMDGVTIHRILSSAKNVDNIIDNFKRSRVFPKSVIEKVPKLDSKENFDLIHFFGSSMRCAGDVKKKTVKPVFATVESPLPLCPKGDLLYFGKKSCDYDCNFSLFVKCFNKSKEIGKMKKSFLLNNRITKKYIYDYYRSFRDSLIHSNIIAISNFIKKRLDNLGLKSEVVPNIVEVERFKGDNKGNKVPKVLYLGSYTGYKGAKVLIEALDGLKCEAEFYGEGILKNDLVKRAKELKKVKVKVNGTVPYDKIPLIYKKSDIVVFPSLWPEPFGRISVEAMASGKPIIASNIGGIGETVKKDYGILVKPGDVNDLREALKKLLKSKKLRQDLGKKGREIAEKKYSAEIVGQKLTKIYEKAL